MLLSTGVTAAQARESTHCTSGRVCVYYDAVYNGTYQFWTNYSGSYGILNNQVSSLVNRVGHQTDFYTGTSYTGSWHGVPALGTRENLASYGWNDTFESHRPH